MVSLNSHWFCPVWLTFGFLAPDFASELNGHSALEPVYKLGNIYILKGLVNVASLFTHVQVEKKLGFV